VIIERSPGQLSADGLPGEPGASAGAPLVRRYMAAQAVPRNPPFFQDLCLLEPHDSMS